MKIICDCGNEDIFNTIDEDTGEETDITEDEGQYATIKEFSFWSRYYSMGLTCNKCGKSMWIFK